MTTKETAPDANRDRSRTDHHNDSPPSVSGHGPFPSVDDEGETWEDPQPIQATVPSTPFPTSALPESVAKFVRAAARSLGVDEAALGSMVLAVLSAATVGRVRVKGFGSHVERIALWLLILAAPGERKTSVLSAAKAPLTEVEDHLRDEALVGRQAAISRLASARKTLKNAESDLADAFAAADDESAVGGPADDDGPLTSPTGSVNTAVDVALKKLDAATERVQESAVPDLPKLTASDVTPEALHDLMVAQGGRLALFIPEGQSLLHRIANGGNGSDLEPYLAGHAGDTMDRDRVTREVGTVKDPSLVMAVMTQPDVFSHKATDEMKWSGFLDRFFIVRPRSLAGTRPARSPEIDPHVKGNYHATVARIVREFWTLEEPRFIELTSDAADLYEAVYNEIEPTLRGDRVPGHSAGWAKKMIGALLRVAGVLAVADNPAATLVEVGHIRAAIELMRFFEAHAATVNRTLMNPDHGAQVETAHRVLEALARVHAVGRQSVTLREVARSIHNGRNADAHQHLTALAELGWVLPEAPGVATSKAVWKLHPALSQWAEKSA